MWDKLYFNYDDDTIIIKKTKFNNFLFKKYLKNEYRINKRTIFRIFKRK
jgi:hypothetical protein